MKTSSSELFIVLIRKRLSYEKKKKDPDFPADSLALKTCCLFLAASRLPRISFEVTLSISLTTSKREGLYSRILTYSLIWRPSSSFKTIDFLKSFAMASGSVTCSALATVFFTSLTYSGLMMVMLFSVIVFVSLF